jgi:hypothetical protein
MVSPPGRGNHGFVTETTVTNPETRARSTGHLPHTRLCTAATARNDTSSTRPAATSTSQKS